MRVDNQAPGNSPDSKMARVADVPRLLCSTGAFTRLPDRSDHSAILTFGPRLDVEGLELLVFPHWELRVVERDLVRSGLRFPAIHADKSVAEGLGSPNVAVRAAATARLIENIRLAESLESETVVLHLWGLPESDANIHGNLEAMAECHDVAAVAGVALAVETVPCTHGTPLANIRELLAAGRPLSVALDTEFLALHGELDRAVEAEWLWDTGAVEHVHIKDYDGAMYDGKGARRYLHPGEGEINFAAVVGALRDRKFAGYLSLESSAVEPNGDVDLERIKNSLVFLTGLLSS
jgi:sugar phosphate isomerase/epimerase